MANRKELVLVTTESGCIVPVSHKLNHDGYFRKQIKGPAGMRTWMYHRWVWTQKFGVIRRAMRLTTNARTEPVVTLNTYSSYCLLNTGLKITLVGTLIRSSKLMNLAATW